MKFIKDLYIELDNRGNLSEFPGQDGKLYFAYNFMSVVSGDQSRGFLELGTPREDHSGNDYFIMEIGGSDISIAIREGGALDAQRFQALEKNYLKGIRERGIDPERLSPIQEEDFENAITDIVSLTPTATIDAKRHAVQSGQAHRALTPDI